MTPRFASKPLRLFAAALLALPLMACAANGQEGTRRDTGETVGTIAGAIGGALLGSRFGRGSGNVLATVAGGALGAYLGGRLGRMLDERDRQMHSEAAAAAMERPAGQTVAWSNAETGNSGSVTPLAQVTRPSDGATCRTFEQRISTGDGRTEAAEGTACREPDGTWRVISQP